MASDIERYLKARTTFSASAQTIAGYAAIASDLAQALRSPGMFSFANTRIGLPMEAVMGRGAKSLDANRWPNAETIQQALATWHAARSEMMNAWSALSPDVKQGLQPPL